MCGIFPEKTVYLGPTTSILIIMLFNLNPTGSVNVVEDIRGAKTHATVSATTTVGVVLAANANRAAYSIFNAGPATVFIREGLLVTPIANETSIPPNFLWKEDYLSARYLGPISVITALGTASLQVSEGSLI